MARLMLNVSVGGIKSMLPRTIACENCGERASVRGYGRVVYASGGPGQIVVEPEIERVHLTIDCPKCGVFVQVYHPKPGELVDTKG
jgi:DNA-directed RNA polymerase subunit RPC12/RpoP